MTPEKSFVFQHEGRYFIARVYRDDDMGFPWDMHDLHGPVRKTADPGPGERRLSGNYWYNWDEALKIAERDGWNAEPFDAPNRWERSVQADYDRLKAFMRDKWHWVGVSVTLCGEDGEILDDNYNHALWGIESDSNRSYFNEVATQLAAEALPEAQCKQA